MKMKSSWSFRIAALAAVLIMSVGLPQAQSNKGKQNQVKPAGVNSSVKGSGTVDHITKWVGDGEIGDSGIIETDGKVRITGSLPFISGVLDGVFNVQNTAMHGWGMNVTSGQHGTAIFAKGIGEGYAVIADGGDDPEFGGLGIVASGGDSTVGNEGFAGFAIGARGGDSATFEGGEGVWATGGRCHSGFGGTGVIGEGGQGSGAGKRGGVGIFGAGGPGVNGATKGHAGLFLGDVEVTGTFSAPIKNFKIDHPLDPENKYLHHTSVESPDMKNIYDGNVVTDENGEATVRLPNYFEALNRDFRYQLTVIGTFAQAIVAEKIKGNRFKIKTSAPGVEVSWQVTGIRHDAWARMNGISVEVEKGEQERGSYLHPEAFNQPKERGIEWAHDRSMMRQLKETRKLRDKNQR